MPFTSPEAGTLSVSWYLVPKGATLTRHAKPVLVASGKLTVAAGVPGQVKVRLTAAGRQALRRAKRVRLVAKGEFVPRENAPVDTVAAFAVHG